MNDRELLELAAKAVGYFIISVQHEKLNVTNDHKKNFHWNPLTDDGDALRLAVTLRILNLDDALFYGDKTIDFQDDPYAANRRAIVRAAAEIGEQMK